MSYQRGEEIHGVLNSADVTTAAEITVYNAGSITARTIAADEHVVITDIQAVGAVAMDIHVYLGTSGTPAAGETVIRGETGDNGGIAFNYIGTGRKGVAGSTPRVLSDTAGQVDVIFTGRIMR